MSLEDMILSNTFFAKHSIIQEEQAHDYQAEAILFPSFCMLCQEHLNYDLPFEAQEKWLALAIPKFIRELGRVSTFKF